MSEKEEKILNKIKNAEKKDIWVELGIGALSLIGVYSGLKLKEPLSIRINNKLGNYMHHCSEVSTNNFRILEDILYAAKGGNT